MLIVKRVLHIIAVNANVIDSAQCQCWLGRRHPGQTLDSDTETKLKYKSKTNHVWDHEILSINYLFSVANLYYEQEYIPVGCVPPAH